MQVPFVTSKQQSVELKSEDDPKRLEAKKIIQKGLEKRNNKSSVPNVIE